MELSSEMIGIFVSASIGCFVLWYYFEKEKKSNNFLVDRIKSAEEEKATAKSARQKDIEAQLDALDNPTTYQELMQKAYMIILGGCLVSVALGVIPICVLFIIIGYKYPSMYLAYKKDKRDKEFEEQLPDAIDQLLAVLRAGQTATQGYRTIAQEAPYPINKEFLKVYTDINTGATIEQALDGLYRRHPLQDIKLLRIGMVISAEATGKVAINTLQQISETIRVRDSQKKETKSTVAQGKYTAIILSALPVFLAVMLFTFMPQYVGSFVSTTMGKVAYCAAGLLDFFGYQVAKKITSEKSIVKY